MKNGHIAGSLILLVLLGAGCAKKTVVPPTATPEPVPAVQPTPTVAPTKPDAVPLPTGIVPPPTTKTITPTPTKTTTKTPAPAPVTKPTVTPTFVSGELSLTISVSAYGADLNWSKAASRDIKGYGVIKSTTDPSPYYPKEFYVHFINDYDTPTWRDTTLEKGKRAYYRICTIGTDDSVKCGNVASALKP